MKDKLRQYINRVFEIFDGLDENGIGINSIIDDEEKMASREVLIADSVLFLLYLSASDGELSESEAEFIGSYLGVHYSTDEMRREIRNNNIYSVEFEQCIPLSVKLMVEADNRVVQSGYIESTGCRMIYDFYKLISQAFLACDNSVTDTELDNMARYLENIKEYINANAMTNAKICSNPFFDAQESKKLVVIYENKKPERRIARVDNSISVKESPAPWDTVYYKHACPYCGKYKVRAAKWDDKQFSVAFWGLYSYKLHCKYKCDSCNNMWN